MKRRLMAIFLALSMLLGLMPVTSFAADAVTSGTCGDNLTWVLDTDGVLTISGTGDMYNYSSYYGNAPWHQQRDNIYSVNIKSGVTSIGQYAFTDYSNLTSVSIPRSITRIGNYAFYSSGLTGVLIPNGIATIGDSAFSYCDDLAYAIIGCDVGIATGATHIGTSAFADCKNLTSVSLGSGVGSIGDGAFSSCSSLSSINIPDTVTSIGVVAFYECYSMTNATIGNGVTSIGERAFYYCRKLNSITIGSGVTSIGKDAFYEIFGLETVNISDLAAWCAIDFDGWGSSPLQCYGELYLNGQRVENLVIPSGVTEISDYAFWRCSSLKNLTIPWGVTSIGDYGFSECKNLSSVTIPNSVTAIGCAAFSDCKNLTSVTIPEGVTQIGASAFAGCSGLTSMTIPAGVTQIGDAAFERCSGITSIAIPEGVTQIGRSVFEGCSGLTNVTIPDSVTSIGYYAFENCTNLKNITLGNGVTTICARAFEGCSKLTSVTIPDGIVCVDGSVFEECNNLNYNVYRGARYLGNAQNPYLVMIEPADSGLTTCLLHEQTKVVASLAFKDFGGLTSVIVPSSVTNIGEYAFVRCADLNEIVFLGDAPAFGEDVFYTVVAKAYYPEENTTWTPDVMQNYGGTITWMTGCAHKWEEATCEQPKTCSVCGTTEGEIIDHSYVEGTCEYCGAVEMIAGGTCGADLTWTLEANGLLTISGTGWMQHFAGYRPWQDHYDKIRYIVIEDGITNIGDYAFYNSINLQSVVIPESVAVIGQHAFFECRSLKNLTLPDSVTEIGMNAFYGCTSLTNFVIPESVTDIGMSAFYGCTGLTSFVIPNGVSDIDCSVFEECANLQRVEITNSVTYISQYAFHNCSALTEIHFGGTEEQWNAIKKDEGWDSGTGAYTVYYAEQEIGIVASGTCGENLKWTLDEEEVLTISGAGAMEETGDAPWYQWRDSILSVVIEEGVTGINYDHLTKSQIIMLHIPQSVTGIFDLEIGDTGTLETIWVHPDNANFSSDENGMLYNKEKTELIRVPGKILGGSLITTFEWIPDTVTSIAQYAFEGCAYIRGIIIPEGVTVINTNAFIRSGITSISLPVSLQKLCPISIRSMHASIEIHYAGSEVQWNAIDKQENWNGGGNHVVLFADIDSCAHSWADATCTEPKTCSVCGETEGEALGHRHVGNSIACMRCGLDRVAYGDCGESVRWVLDSAGLLTIYGTGEMNHFDQGGAPWYAYRTKTTAAEILDGVTSIGSSAFYAFYKLERVAMADSIVSIGNGAFEDCRALDGVQLSADLKSLNGYAFRNCSNLTSIVIPEGVTVIQDETFNGCTSLRSAVLPKSITEIRGGAFYNCSSLTSIVIPEGVAVLHSMAFADCTSLESVVLPDGLVSIWSMAFSGCRSLQSIEIPDTVSSIGNDVFNGCSSLTSIVIPEGVTTIESGTFSGCSSLQSVVLPDSLISIGGTAFRDCSSLQNIEIPSAVRSIGDWAFLDCSSLQSIVIPESVTEIADLTFLRCTSLQSVVLPDGITTIGNQAFYGCSSLTSIVLPKDVTSIEEHAFDGCSSLQSVVIPEGITGISAYTFAGCSSLTSIAIPEGVTVIAYQAFGGCSSLQSVVIPESVTVIGERAFYCCENLQSIVISDSVTSIGDEAFWCCSSLQSIEIPKGITVIGHGLFGLCGNLQSVVIPTGVTSISDLAFTGCEDLQSIAIPETVSSIGADAFANCYDLWHVFYGGTEEEWNAIVIDNANEANGYLTDATRHYECTGEETLDLETGVCSVCASICEHEWIDATCDAPQTCSLCGTTEGDPVHQWLDATCEDAQICSACGVTEGEALGHDWCITINKVPTADKQGACAVQCARCEEKEKLVLPVLNSSDYTYEVILPATATADGYGQYTWNVTGYGPIRFYEVIRHAVSEEDAQLVIQSATTVVGNTIRLEVMLKNNPGLQGIYAWLQYDSSALELVSVENGTILDNLTAGSCLVWDDEKNTMEDGILCVLEFRVAENALAGEYVIGLVLKEVLNEQLQTVPLHVLYSTVKVIQIVYGDANGDGMVSLKDVLLLRQYLANYDPDTGESTVIVEDGADANGDGSVTLKDVLLLRTYLANRDLVTDQSTVVLGPQ